MAVLYCKVMGIVFLAIGILGCFTGQTLVVFGINALHNLVHILSGAIALWAGFTSESNAKAYCLWFGLIYAAVAVLGLLNVGFVNSLLNLNKWDDLLHLLIATTALYVRFGKQSAAKV